MGTKRSCTCGCWSEVQQECLYTGSGCFYDDERKQPTVNKEFVEKWGRKLNAHRINDFEIMLKEAGVGIEEK